MPTEVMPLPSELRSVTTSAAANHRSLITNLSVDWQTLLAQLQAGTPPTVSDPPPQTQNSAFTGTTCNGSSVPLAKKVIRLVAKRPLTSILSQSQSGASIVRSCSNSVSSTKCPPEPHDFIVSSVAEADSVVMKPTDFHTELSSQELVTSCNTGSPSGYMESSLVEGNLGSPEGHLGSFEIIWRSFDVLMNPSKTEVMWLGTSQLLDTITIGNVPLLSTVVIISQLPELCKWIEYWCIEYLIFSGHCLLTLPRHFVSSRLDCCNALLPRTPPCDL